MPQRPPAKRAPTPRAAPRRAALARALLLLALLTACGPALAPPATPTPDAPISAPDTPIAAPDPGAADPTPAAPAPRVALAAPEFAAQIAALLGDRAGRYSIAITLPGGAIEFQNRANAQIEAASLYKLPIMIELYAERAAGTLSFAETLTLEPAHFLEDTGESYAIGDRVSIRALLDSMITASSNVAAAALLARVGNGNVNATMARLGLSSTEIRWMPGGLPSAATPRATSAGPSAEPIYNVTSAADMALLFRELLDGAVVSADASAEMLRLLARQQINDRLPALLPDGTMVAHKTGNLPGIVHDAGVIYTPDGPAVVAVLADGADEQEAAQFIARLGALVYFAPR